MRALSKRSLLWGLGGSLGLAALYALIVGGASGSLRHLAEQAGSDWYLLLPLALGFGLQLSLRVELRKRHRLHAATATAGTAGAGASTAGMVACCAHHVADLAPFLGASGAATFLIDYRIPFIVGGLGITAIGVAISARRLRQTICATAPEVTAWAA
jgi:hypothetical protein